MTERIPSCDEGLVEYLNGKCLRPGCGALNQAACKVTERIPSCDKGLRETADGICVVLKPGEIPIFATVGDWSSELAKVAEGECIHALEGLSSVPAGIGGFGRLEPQQAKYFKIGFTCGALSKLGQLSGYTDMVQDMNRQMQVYPCAAMTPVLRPVCALYETHVSTFGAAATCGIALAKEGMIRSEGGAVRDTWLGIGKMAWVVADALDYGKNKSKDGDKVKNGQQGSRGRQAERDGRRAQKIRAGGRLYRRGTENAQWADVRAGLGAVDCPLWVISGPRG